jgi:predicted glutamine amidotransferase
MCRLLGWVSREPATAREVLGDEAVAAFVRLARYHADGWGAALDGPDGPTVERSTLRADTDPAFAAVLTTRATRAGLVHTRWATPGLPIELRNTHPFTYSGNVFMHNGAIYPVNQLDSVVPEPWSSRLQGTTDSEKYFLAIMAELEQPGTDLPAAITRVVGRLTRDFRPSSLNALLETPSAVYAINDHDPDAAPSSSPPTAGESASVDHATHFNLHHHITNDAVIVASSGFVPADADGWELLPNHMVLVIDKTTLATQSVALGR